jgi:hypothetical protein
MASQINKGGSQYFSGGLRVRQRVIASAAATVTIPNSGRNAIYLFDRASGVTYTLPKPVPGVSVGFYTSVSVTSNGHKVITDASTTFLTGALIGMNTGSADAMLAFSGNGTTHISVNMLAASTNQAGGLVGSYMVFTATSTTNWVVSGQYQAGTTATTPFATS